MAKKQKRTTLITPAERPKRKLAFGPLGGLLAALSGTVVLVLRGTAAAASNAPIRWALGAVGVASACVIAAWAEERIYAAAAGRNAILRVVVGVGVPGIAGFLAVVGAPYVRQLLIGLGDPYLVAAILFGFFSWMASAGLGSLLVILLDLVISFLVRDLRSRITLAVLGLVVIVTSFTLGLAELLPTMASAVDANRGSFAARLASMALRPDEVQLLLSPPPTAQLTSGLGVTGAQVERFLHAGSFTFLFFLIAGLIGLPAVVSACAKLADATMERLHPLRRAFQLLAKGRLDVRVEEAGSRDFVALNRHFNQMVQSLAQSRQLENAFGLYVSEPVLERIRGQHGEAAIPASLRQATVFFADIRGFTTMSEKLEPAQVLEVLNRYFEAVVPTIEEHEGYLDKFIGDAMVVVFNGPIDQPDHPERAVRCAIALQQKVAQLNAGNMFHEVGGLQVGVGIASGPLVAGNLGSARKLEYTVIGDTVNLASRLTSKASGGEVWVNDTCAEGLPAELPRVPLGAIQVKGKAQPVRPFRLWPVDATEKVRAQAG